MHESRLPRASRSHSECWDEDELGFEVDSWNAAEPNVGDESWLDDDPWLDEDSWLDTGPSTVSVDSLGRVHISLG